MIQAINEVVKALALGDSRIINCPFCLAVAGSAAALPLAYIVLLYGASGRLASHPATTAIMDNLLFESPLFHMQDYDRMFIYFSTV
jgi:hypothetical protein